MARENGEDPDHLYVIIPQIIDCMRASCQIPFDTAADIDAIFTRTECSNDEVAKFKHYRTFASGHMRKYDLRVHLVASSTCASHGARPTRRQP